MIDIVKSLRRIAEEGYRFAGDAADEIERLRSRLEAAEKSDAESMAMYRRVRGERDALRAKIEAAEKERDNANAASVNIALEAERLQCENDALRAALQHEADCVEAAKAEIEALRAKIAEMERQEPVRHEFQGRDGDWYPFINQRHYENTVADGTWPIRALYALPGAQPAPSVPDIDYLVDTLSEFADHHVEHGRMSFDKWTLRSAVEAMLSASPEAKP